MNSTTTNRDNWINENNRGEENFNQGFTESETWKVGVETKDKSETNSSQQQIDINNLLNQNSQSNAEHNWSKEDDNWEEIKVELGKL